MPQLKVDYRTLPPVDRADMVRDLWNMGLRTGDSVLVHSAMSRIGNVQGGAAAVVDAFLEVLGPHGTLAVPTFPFTGSMLAHVRSDPEFDVDETPSLMGTITEEVRTHSGALRSLEPTHPVAAFGPRAAFLVEDHLNSEGSCDAHSPLYRLTLPVAADPGESYVLLIGVNFRNCTLLHTAEEVARVPFIDFKTRYRVRGRTRRGAYALSIYCHSTPLRANFPAIEPVLLERNRLAIGRVGSAECRLARASDILEAARDRLATDPYFLRVHEGSSAGASPPPAAASTLPDPPSSRQ
ncbi:MAG: AAC(3) family N-acetyltransferase [Chloroflexota bacterium]